MHLNQTPFDEHSSDGSFGFWYGFNGSAMDLISKGFQIKSLLGAPNGEAGNPCEKWGR